MDAAKRAENVMLNLPAWRGDCDWDGCVQAIAAAIREAEVEALERAAKVADGWADNYPPDVFTGETEEGRHGRFGRHVAQCIAEDIRRSLKETTP